MMFSKRTMTAALAAAAVALPALAWGATTRYTGEIQGNGRVSFNLQKQGDVRTILDFTGKRVRAKCDEGRGRISGTAAPDSIPVKDNGRFKYAFDGVGGELDVTGIIKPGGKAAGTYREFLVTADATHHNCETGIRDWSASR